MKRSTAIEGLVNLIEIMTNVDEKNGYTSDVVADTVLTYLEELDMLPPPQTCNIIYDEKGPKHNEATRKWDNE